MASEQLAEKRPATLGAVAEQAGVSKMAVSVVLNGARSGTRVSAETRQRIQDAARALGYQPNALARSLRQRRTDTLGFHTSYGVNPLHNPFMVSVIHGLYRGVALNNKTLILNAARNQVDTEGVLRELNAGRVDGLIVHCRFADSLPERLSQASLPAVAIVDETPLLPSVVADEEEGGRLIADHLRERGHRQVLYQRSSVPFVSAEARWQAFARAAEAAGLDVIVFFDDVTNLTIHGEMAEVLLGRRGARPTAFIGWNDYQAYQALEFCAAHGLCVPQNLAVVGFNGGEFAPWAQGRLTTVQAGWSEVAQTAVELLCRRTDGHEIPMKTVSPVWLDVGTTT